MLSADGTSHASISTAKWLVVQLRLTEKMNMENIYEYEKVCTVPQAVSK